MSGNRPRSSLINLFDPLSNSTTELPSTPDRNALDVDKEKNTTPNTLAMTMFFNQIAKQASHPQPVPLKRRLIDIGDMTLEDAACPESLVDEGLEDEFSVRFDQVDDDEENATLTFKDMVKAATPIKPLKTVPESPTDESFPALRIPLPEPTVEETIPVPDSMPDTVPLLPKIALEEPIPGETLQLEEQAPESVSAPEPLPEEPVVELLVGPPLAPENIPLPDSPITTIQELPSTDLIPAPATELELPESDSSTATAVSNDDSVTTNTSTVHAEANTNPEISSLDISNILTPFGASPGSSNSLLADTSIPIVLSHSPSADTSLAVPETESDKENSPIARLRPNPPNTSSHDISRFSVDLYASFQMQMQSEDLSFDLLGDRMSFLNSRTGMESFLSTIEDDPSFDLETERINMEKALKEHSMVKDEKAEKAPVADDSSSVSSSSAPATPVDVLSVPSTPGHDCDDIPVKTGPDLKTVRKRLSIPIAISSPRLINVSSPLTGKSPLSRPSSISFSPSQGESETTSMRSPTAAPFSPVMSPVLRRSSLQLVTPKFTKDSGVPSLPPALPALKIAKRPRPNGHGRSNSTLSTSDQKSGSVPPPKVADLPSVAQLKARKTTKEQETTQVTEPESQPSRQQTKRRPLVSSRPPLSATQTGGQGPRRVPVSEGPRLGSVDLKSTTTTSASGPRRVPAPSTAAIQTATQARSSSATPTGLRLPTQVGTTASTIPSSLPKPVSRPSLTSRLPAPKSLKTGGLPIFRRPT